MMSENPLVESNGKEVIAARQGRGITDVDQRDINFSRIVLTQDMSKFVKDGTFKAGVFVDNTTMRGLGKELEFVPVLQYKYYDLLKPEGNKMVFESRVHEKPEGRIFFNDRKNNIRADCNSVIAFLSLLGGNPAIITFSKTSYIGGKDIVTHYQELVREAKKIGEEIPDLFAHTYKLIVTSSEKGGDTFYVSRVKPLGPSNAEDLQLAEMLWNSTDKASVLKKQDESKEEAQV